MSNFIDFYPVSASQSQDAPNQFMCSTADALNVITAAGYLNDKYNTPAGIGPIINPFDILYINYLVGGAEASTAGTAVLSGDNLNFVAGLPGGGGGSGDVDSVFGRTGDVTAQTGDYTVSEVTGAAPLASPTFTGTVTTAALTTVGTASINATGAAATTIGTGGTGAVNIGNATGNTAITGDVVASGKVTATAHAATGLTGAVSASRYVGATASGAPVAGAFLVGDFVVAQDGHVFVCTVAGSPGTWVDVGLGGGLPSLTDGRVWIGNSSNVATAVALSGDVTTNNAGVTAIGTGVIVNADVNAGAAIALTKLAAMTASVVPVASASGFLVPSAVTDTELGYLSGVTSAIQTQFAAKQDKAVTGGGAATAGTATLNGATPVVISTTAVEAGSIILLSRNASAGTPGVIELGTIVAGTSFAISSTALDTSTVNWYIAA